jgi:hypothetical protein
MALTPPNRRDVHYATPLTRCAVRGHSPPLTLQRPVRVAVAATCMSENGECTAAERA